jgi:hypothetical protein
MCTNVSEILGDKSGVLNEGLSFGVECGEEHPQPRGCVRDDAGIQGLKSRTEHAGVDFREEQGGPPAERGEAVAEATGHAAEQALARKPAEVIAHLPRGVVVVGNAEQLGHERSQATIGESLGRADEEAERAQKRHRPRLAELQRGRRLALGGLRGQQILLDDVILPFALPELNPRDVTGITPGPQA